MCTRNSVNINTGIVLRLRVCLIPCFCRATELDLRGYWREKSHYYYGMAWVMHSARNRTKLLQYLDMKATKFRLKYYAIGITSHVLIYLFV